MPTISIKITNMPQIQRAFAQSPRLMARGLDMAIKKTVLNISRDSRQNTPVDTGRLRASTYERFNFSQGEVGTNTEYDIFVHEGTRFQKARPYLREAVDENASLADRFFTEAVQSVLTTIGRQT